MDGEDSNPSSSLLEAVQDAEDELEKEKMWTCSEFIVEFATSFNDDSPNMVNVMNHLGFKTRLTEKKKREHITKRKWLPIVHPFPHSTP